MADCAGSEPVGEMTLSTLNSLVARSILLLSCKLKDPERPEKSCSTWALLGNLRYLMERSRRSQIDPEPAFMSAGHRC